MSWITKVIKKKNENGKIETYKIVDFDVVSLYPSFQNAKLIWPLKSRKEKIKELLKENKNI